MPDSRFLPGRGDRVNIEVVPVLDAFSLFFFAPRPGASLRAAGGIVDDQYLFVDEKSCNDKKQSCFHKKRNCYFEPKSVFKEAQSVLIFGQSHGKIRKSGVKTVLNGTNPSYTFRAAVPYCGGQGLTALL